jgi:hypothetical protein
MALRVTAHFDSESHPTQVWEFPASYTRPQIERIVLGFAENRGLRIVEENGIQCEELSPRRHLRRVK